MYNANQYQKTFLGGAVQAAGLIGGTAQIFSGQGTLHGIVVSTTTGTQFIVSDSVAQTGTILTDGSTAMILKASVTEGVFTPIDAVFSKGLYVTFGVSGSYTVLWTK